MKKINLAGLLSLAAATALSLSSMATISAAADAAPAEFNPDGEYNAYLGIQSENWIFRNAYDDATYGFGKDMFNGLYHTDNGVIPGTFTDTKITGNGTYTVTLTDFDFGTDEKLNLLFVSTDIPLNDAIKITDVKVKMDGSTKHTFDEAFADPDAKQYVKFIAINKWNSDLGGEDGLFGYTMPTSEISMEFTISGFNYDNPNAVAETTPEETEAPATTEAATEPVEETKAAETTAAATTAAAETPADSSSDGFNPLPIIIGVAAVAVIAVVIFVVVKKKK